MNLLVTLLVPSFCTTLVQPVPLNFLYFPQNAAYIRPNYVRFLHPRQSYNPPQDNFLIFSLTLLPHYTVFSRTFWLQSSSPKIPFSSDFDVFILESLGTVNLVNPASPSGLRSPSPYQPRILSNSSANLRVLFVPLTVSLR